MLAVSQIRWAVVWPPAPLHSALNHPRFRVTNLDGVQVECEAHVPCERNGSPSCPWFRVMGQLPPSLLLTEHPRWFLWVRVSSVPASLFLFCCSAYVPRNDTFSLAWPLLLGCLWASFLSLSWDLCTCCASRPGSVSPRKCLAWGAFPSSCFWPTPSSPSSSLQTPGNFPAAGSTSPMPSTLVLATSGVAGLLAPDALPGELSGC